MTLAAQPQDILRHIFSYLNMTDLCRLSRANKSLRRAARETKVWKECGRPCVRTVSGECSTTLLCVRTRDSLLLMHHLGTCPTVRGLLLEGRPCNRSRLALSAYVGEVDTLARLLGESKNAESDLRVALAMALHGGSLGAVKFLVEGGRVTKEDVIYEVRGTRQYLFSTRKEGMSDVIEYLWREADLDLGTATTFALLGEHYAFLDKIADAGRAVDWDKAHMGADMSGLLTQSARLYCLQKGASVNVHHFLHPPCELALEYYANKGVLSWVDMFALSCMHLRHTAAQLCAGRIDAREIVPVVERTKIRFNHYWETGSFVVTEETRGGISLIEALFDSLLQRGRLPINH